jgi:transcription initiation factor TFIIB
MMKETSEQTSDKDNSMVSDACEYCGEKEIILEEGNYVCKACNTISTRFIDSNAEWRYYGSEDKGSDPSRCGMPTSELLPNSSLGSVIGNSWKESYDMRKIRKYHMWNSMPYKDRTLYNIFENISTHASNGGISNSIIEEAKMLYKQIAEAKITRGDNKTGLIASSIYMSCKTNKVPRSTKEIANIFNVKLTTMTKACKKFQDIMRLDVNSSTPEDFIKRFSSKMNLSQEVVELSRHIVKRADELNIAYENTPPSVAAGSLYLCILITDAPVSKKELSAACEISPVTITKCYKRLYENRAIILPDDIIMKYKVE